MEQTNLYGRLASKTETFRSARDALGVKKAAIDSEIEELLTKLSALFAKSSKLGVEIAEKTRMLDEACEEFAVEEGELDKRESALDDENEKLKQMQDATDNLKARYTEEN